MASNLRVDNIQPSTAMGIGIGTANGSVTFNADVTGGLNITSGSVGIGTSNPTQDLEIQDDTLPTVIVRNRTSSSYSRVLLDEVGDSGGAFTINRLGSTSSAIGGARAGQIWNHANAPIVFGTNDTEAARFNASGNLAFVSGNGIDFSATADGGGTTTSELLDDYEEGLWTPQVTQGVSGTPTYEYQLGWYTKIGRIVTLYFYIKFASTGNTGSNTHIHVGNFPFPIVSTNNGTLQRGMGVSNYHSIPGFTSANVSFYGAGNSNTFASVYQGNQGVATSSAVNSQYIIGGIEYISE